MAPALNAATGQITDSIILAGKKRSLVGSLVATSPAYATGYITGTSKNVLFSIVP